MGTKVAGKMRASSITGMAGSSTPKKPPYSKKLSLSPCPVPSCQNARWAGVGGPGARSGRGVEQSG